MEKFSIIICSYNPHVRILKRLLDAVKSFGAERLLRSDIIIVDNNSTPPLSENIPVRDFLSSIPTASLVTEKSPGLTNARIAGINASKYSWVIFFDDDNEPNSDYLMKAEEVINKYPQVGVWGPGNITVDYVERKATPFLDELRILFQERKMNETLFDNDIIEGNVCYPYGTGMLVRRNILVKYINSVSSNKYTMSDRKGESLISAGDTQILYTGLKMNYYAGSAAELRLKHIITPNKTKLKYVLKLIYSLHSSQIKAYNEVFNGSPHILKAVSDKEISYALITFLKGCIRRRFYFKKNLMMISQKLGSFNARILAGNFKKPLLLKWWEKRIGVN